ncbi:MAG: arylamine N-acetyltransferase [Thermoanaerobaculia bacterium]
MSAPDWLEALGLPSRAPDLVYLRELFRAFNEKVPFETASKIVRNSEIADPPEKPRRPGLFWADHLERGAGGTCFARVAAFEALILGLGFSARRRIGAIGSPRNHASLVVAVAGREWLVDVGYPLPDIFALSPAEHETLSGRIRLTVDGDAATLLFASGPDQGRSIRFELAGVSDAEFENAWRRTFAPTSMFLTDVVLQRQGEGRILRFHRGEVQILDDGSRTRIPLRDGRSAKLAGIFEIDRGLLDRALELTGDPDPSLQNARVEVFREGGDAEELLRAIAGPEGYRRYADGLGRVEVRSTGDLAFEASIAPDRGEPALESVRYEPEEKRLTIDRNSGLRRTGFQVETTETGPRLVRFAELPDAREEFLKSDLGRARIAAVLGMDLAALSRL